MAQHEQRQNHGASGSPAPEREARLNTLLDRIRSEHVASYKTFATAGGHFNPGGLTHRDHAGDMPVLLVNANGTGEARFKISIGIAQFLALRRQISRAGWWVVANGVGCALFFAAATSLGGEGREFIALSVGGALFGAVTGLALVGLLRQPKDEA